jgi:hypothetical protein
MAGLGGPGVRLMSKQAERTFIAKMDLLDLRFYRPTVSWVVADAMEVGDLPFNEKFYLFRVQRPAYPSIDVGRESMANLNEYRAGVMSGQEICNERGRDVYDVQKEKAREIANAKKLAVEFGVPFEMIISMSTGGSPTPSAAPAPDNEDPEETPAPPAKKPADAEDDGGEGKPTEDE